MILIKIFLNSNLLEKFYKSPKSDLGVLQGDHQLLAKAHQHKGSNHNTMNF